MPIVNLLFLLVFSTRCIPISYGLKAGYIQFTETSPNQKVTLPHYNDPILIYALSSINFTNYFSFFSNYTIIQHPQQDDLKMSVQIGGTLLFKILISYIYMEPMPNIQMASLNLTAKKPLLVYSSLKQLKFNEDTYVSALLIGFSSSNFTKNNYFTSSKGSYTYSFYTNLILGESDWIAFNFIILQSNYQINNMICTGSYIFIDIQQQSQNGQLKKIDVQPNSHFLLGLQAIQTSIGVFIFDYRNMTINMGMESGLFSYSTIIVNNTCDSIFNKQLYEPTRSQKKYLGLMIVFIILFLILTTTVVTCLLKKRRRMGDNISQIKTQSRSDTNIIEASEGSKSNQRNSEDNQISRNSKQQKKPQKPRMVLSVLDKIEKRRTSIQNQQQQLKRSSKNKTMMEHINNSSQNKEQPKNRSLRLNEQKYIQTEDINIADNAPATEVRLKSQVNIVYCLVCSNQLSSQKQICAVCQNNKIQ